MGSLQKLLVLVLVVTYMLQAGLAAPPNTFRNVRPSTIVRGLLVMLVLGPLVAAVMARAVEGWPALVVALVLLSTVGVLPLAARSVREDSGCAATALVLTLTLAVLAIFTAVPSTRLLLPYGGHGARQLLQPGPLLLHVLVLQGAPLAVGVMIARTSAFARTLEGWMTLVNRLVLGAVVLAIFIPHLGAVMAVGWRGAAAGFLFAIALAAIAYVVGGPSLADRRAIVASANKPNVALALTIVTGAELGQPFAAAVVGVFLVRVITGLVIERLFARQVHRLAAAHG